MRRLTETVYRTGDGKDTLLVTQGQVPQTVLTPETPEQSVALAKALLHSAEPTGVPHCDLAAAPTTRRVWVADDGRLLLAVEDGTIHVYVFSCKRSETEALITALVEATAAIAEQPPAAAGAQRAVEEVAA